MEPSSIIYTEESTLLDEVIKWMEPLRRYGIVVLKIRDRYALGYSDLFICARGRFIVAELKDDVGKPSIHQDDFINLMTRADASGGICRSVKDVADLISEALYCTCGSQASAIYCPKCGKEVVLDARYKYSYIR